MTTTFYAVRDRDRDRRDVYAVVALSDQLRPGYMRAYRWVPNFGEWVADRGLMVDFRTRVMDQLNIFEPLEPLEAARLARSMPKFTARWVLDSYKGESERLTSTDLGLPVDVDQPRPTTDPQMVEVVRKAALGTWITVREFPPDKGLAARKWVSEVRLGQKKRLAALGDLEARVEPRQGVLVAMVRRVTTSAALVATAQRIAEEAHAGQFDKAGRPYIGHPRRVAARLQKANAPAEAVAAGWLHDVLEDTEVTANDLREAGVPEVTIAAVEAVTKRSGESMEDYAARINATSLAPEVKHADLADNSDPERLALLDASTRTRLKGKYARMHELLSEQAVPLPSYAWALKGHKMKNPVTSATHDRS